MVDEEFVPRAGRPTTPGKGGQPHLAALVVLALLALSACAGLPTRGVGATEVTNAAPGVRSAPARTDAAAEQLRVQVLSTRPHDPGAFTQGLLLYDGYLYESTGIPGRSTVRQVDPQTGEVVRRVNDDPQVF